MKCANNDAGGRRKDGVMRDKAGLRWFFSFFFLFLSCFLVFLFSCFLFLVGRYYGVTMHLLAHTWLGPRYEFSVLIASERGSTIDDLEQYRLEVYGVLCRWCMESVKGSMQYIHRLVDCLMRKRWAGMLQYFYMNNPRFVRVRRGHGVVVFGAT